MAIETEFSMPQIAGQLSKFVGRLLKRGACPVDLTYALAAVATDMGLSVGKDPYKVLPVILQAVSQQLALRRETAENADAEDVIDLKPIEPGASIH